MIINSIEFILFLILLVLVYKIIPPKFKWVVLLLASYIFFILNSSIYTIFIVLSTLIIYFSALKIDKLNEELNIKLKKIDNKEEKKKLKNNIKSKNKKVVCICIILNLIVLFVLKYTGFVIQEINKIGNFNLPIFKFLLPLGISYYTLQAISYIVDVYRGKIKADKHLGKVALFLVFFPQLIQGPIGRFDKLANQLFEAHDITFKSLTFGTELMLWGYFKKMVIADRLALYVNEVFQNYNEYVFLPIVLAIIGYTIQIYAEFSGGIDIVRGVAEIFGIILDQNFARPFFAKSIDEFWRRWNITLGAWLKEYVFYPVSLSKVQMRITNISNKIFKKIYLSKIIPIAFSLLCVWICNGIWHGAGWKYIVYGLYYYTIMMLGKIFKPISDKIIRIFKIRTQVWSFKLFQMIRTFGLVCIGMLIFRAESLKIAIKMFKSIFTVHNLELLFNGEIFLLGGIGVQDIIIIIMSILLMLVISIKQEHGMKIREKFNEQNLVFRWIILYGLIICILVFGIYGKEYNVQNFIYGQF